MSLCRPSSSRSLFRYFSNSISRYGTTSSLLQNHHGFINITDRTTYNKQEQQKRWISKKKVKKGKALAAAANEETSPSSSNSNDGNELTFELDDMDDDDDNDDELQLLPDPSKVKKDMTKVVDRLVAHFKSIRGSEPTPELFDNITVNAYGEKTPLAGVAQVVIQTPTLAHVTCFDPSVASDVRKAIMEKLDLNPELEESGNLKVILPRISMEIRKKTVTQLRKQTEVARTRIRNLRKKPMKKIKLGKEGKLEGVSEDDSFRVLKEIDEVTEDVNKLLNTILEKKEKSVLMV